MAAVLPVVPLDPGNLLPMLVCDHCRECIQLHQVEVPDLYLKLGISHLVGVPRIFSDFSNHQVTLAAQSGKQQSLKTKLLLLPSNTTNQVSSMC